MRGLGKSPRIFKVRSLRDEDEHRPADSRRAAHDPGSCGRTCPSGGCPDGTGPPRGLSAPLPYVGLQTVRTTR
ncbi:hypothetical protein ACWEQN_46330 [Streptomyces sp. NPDC004129]